jgi:hypothetical protein
MRKLMLVLPLLWWPSLVSATSTVKEHITKPAAQPPSTSSSAGDSHVFDMKTGLWRLTLQADVSGVSQMSPSALSHLTPQQRALMLVMAKAQPQPPLIYTNCVTRDELVHSDHITLNNGSDTWNCTDSGLIALDVNTVAFKGDCTNKNNGTRMKGSGKFHLVDRKDFNASGKIKTYQAGESVPSMVNQVTLKGKWIEATCPAVP